LALNRNIPLCKLKCPRGQVKDSCKDKQKEGKVRIKKKKKNAETKEKEREKKSSGLPIMPL